MSDKIANEAALLRYERSGGQAWYLDKEGNPQPYIPGVSDLGSGTSLFRNPPSAVTVAPVPNNPVQSATVTAEQNYGTLPTGSETIGTQAATVTSSEISQIAAAQSSPPAESSGGGGQSSTQSEPLGGSGEGIGTSGFNLLSALGQSAIEAALSGIVAGFPLPSSIHMKAYGPSDTQEGISAEGAWNELAGALSNTVPGYIASAKALAQRGW